MNREESPDPVLRIRSARQTIRHELQRLAQRPDEEIDLSDIPEIPSEAVTGSFYRPQQQSAPLRLDAAVLARLKASADGYPTRVKRDRRELTLQRRAS
jgi:uncharacterized protein (DUF4415 family)